MQYRIEKKDAPGRGKVDVLGATFEEGKPTDRKLGSWRQKLEAREDKIRYLQNGERYWYGKDWFGSEKRKNPA